MQPLIDAMAPLLFGGGASEATSGRVLEMMRCNNPLGAAAALRGRASWPEYRDGLRALATPTFVCVGTLDTCSTEEVTAELIRALRSPVVVRLPEVGHLPNLEEPDRFNVELSTFLMAASRER